jgi:hypothetical protein
MHLNSNLITAMQAVKPGSGFDYSTYRSVVLTLNLEP